MVKGKRFWSKILGKMNKSVRKGIIIDTLTRCKTVYLGDRSPKIRIHEIQPF